jgi:beta-phosphoglucomutase-like phosphatase (HAD superfamily)
MTVSAVTPRKATQGGPRATRRPRPRIAARRADTPDVAPPPSGVEVQTVAAQWQRALDAGERALSAANGSLPPAELVELRHELVRERREVAEALARLADAGGVRPAPWLSPVPVTATMLGLARHIRACLFDVEGVLTDSSVLHVRAWGDVFDDLLLRLSEKTGRHFIPFDRVVDYSAYVDGRSRLDGVHLFLDSRGIRLPEGGFDDPVDADTVWGVAKRKGEAVARGLRERGVTALEGARRYLEAADRAGIKRGVISASTSTLPVLELAGLAALVEERVDADAISAEGLRSRPAPDQLLVACRRLGVRPEEAVTITHSPAGVAAGLAAGLTVLAVGDGEQAERLRGFGAERLVPSLRALLDPRLSDDRGARPQHA